MVILQGEKLEMEKKNEETKNRNKQGHEDMTEWLASPSENTHRIRGNPGRSDGRCRKSDLFLLPDFSSTRINFRKLEHPTSGIAQGHKI